MAKRHIPRTEEPPGCADLFILSWEICGPPLQANRLTKASKGIGGPLFSVSQNPQRSLQFSFGNDVLTFKSHCYAISAELLTHTTIVWLNY